MDSQQQRDTARKVEVGTSVVAGSVGSALGASKLRDSYHKQYRKSFATGERRLTRVAGPTLAGKIAHSEPGFKALAVGAATAGVAHAASKYRQNKDHQHARRVVAMAKADTSPPGTRVFVRGVEHRIMHYNGNGHFWVIARDDTRRLVHRDQLTFARKPQKVAKGIADHAMNQVDAVDDRARKLRARAIPTKGRVLTSAANATEKLKVKVQEDLNKAYSYQKGPKRRRRAVEVAAAGGAGAAVATAETERRDGLGRWAASSSAEGDAVQHLHMARQNGGHVAIRLAEHADRARQGFGPGLQNSHVELGRTFNLHQAEYKHLEQGTGHLVRAFGQAVIADKTMTRARNKVALAAGLTATAAAAHRSASKNR